MAESKWYEVRLRGQFMLDGIIVQAANHEMAMRHPMGGNNVDSIVIEVDTEDNWWLISKNNYFSQPIVKIGEKTLNPGDHEPQERLELAIACELILQEDEKNPNMEFSNFHKQTEEYEKADEFFAKQWIKDRESSIENAKINAAECIKECLIAETATIAGEGEKAGRSMQYAYNLYQEAKMLADASHTGNFISNTADKNVLNAYTQFYITKEKNKQFRNKTISMNEAKELEIT